MNFTKKKPEKPPERNADVRDDTKDEGKEVITTPAETTTNVPYRHFTKIAGH